MGISKQEVMNLLREVWPSYETRWTQYVEENYELGDEPLVYIDLSNFAGHLFELYVQNKLEEFPAVFGVVEMLHINGDDYVQEAITVGLLEDLQNHLLANKISLDVMKPFLKEESLKWWNSLIDYWDGKLTK